VFSSPQGQHHGALIRHTDTSGGYKLRL